jgi:hypothetical protein
MIATVQLRELVLISGSMGRTECRHEHDRIVHSTEMQPPSNLQNRQRWFRSLPPDFPIDSRE